MRCIPKAKPKNDGSKPRQQNGYSSKQVKKIDRQFFFRVKANMTHKQEKNVEFGEKQANKPSPRKKNPI